MATISRFSVNHKRFYSEAIEMNINPVLNDANVGGDDYLRNLVHLPFFLQNAALRKVKHVKMLESTMKSAAEEDNVGASEIGSRPSGTLRYLYQHYGDIL